MMNADAPTVEPSRVLPHRDRQRRNGSTLLSGYPEPDNMAGNGPFVYFGNSAAFRCNVRDHKTAAVYISSICGRRGNRHGHRHGNKILRGK